jgi:hypothetical protein
MAGAIILVSLQNHNLAIFQVMRNGHIAAITVFKPPKV